MSVYDKYYLEPNHFGRPYADLMDYFEGVAKKGKRVDLGAGQGRDAIPPI